MADVGSIRVRLTAATAQFQKRIKDAQSRLQKFKKVVGTVAKPLGILGGAATAAAAGFIYFTKQSLETISTQAKVARQFGGTTKAIQTLDRAAQISGLNDFAERLKNFNKAIANAERGSGQAGVAFQRLGIDISELKNLDVDQRLIAFGEALDRLGVSSVDRIGILQELQIEERRFLNLIEFGGKAIKTARDELRQFGVGIDDELEAARIEDALDAFERLGLFVTRLKQDLALAAAPFVQALSDKATEAAGKIGDLRAMFENLFKTIIRVTASAADMALKFIPRTEEERAVAKRLDGLRKIEEAAKRGSIVHVRERQVIARALGASLADASAAIESTTDEGRALLQSFNDEQLKLAAAWPHLAGTMRAAGDEIIRVFEEGKKAAAEAKGEVTGGGGSINTGIGADEGAARLAAFEKVQAELTAARRSAYENEAADLKAKFEAQQQIIDNAAEVERQAVAERFDALALLENDYRQASAGLSGPDLDEVQALYDAEKALLTSALQRKLDAEAATTEARKRLAEQFALDKAALLERELEGFNEVQARMQESQNSAYENDLAALTERYNAEVAIVKEAAEKATITEANKVATLKALAEELEENQAALFESEMERLAFRDEANKSQAERLAEQMQADIERETELQQQRLEALQAALAAETLTKEQQRAQELAATEAHEATLEGIRKKYRDSQEKLDKLQFERRVAMASSTLKRLSNAIQGEGKKAFAIKKALNVAGAIMDTYGAVQRTRREFPFPWSAIFGAIELAAGLANVRGILATTPGGGGSVSSAGASASGGAGASASAGALARAGAGAGAPALPSSSESTQGQTLERRALDISITGIDPVATFSGEQVSQIIEAINEQLDDGATLGRVTVTA